MSLENEAVIATFRAGPGDPARQMIVVGTPVSISEWRELMREALTHEPSQRLWAYNAFDVERVATVVRDVESAFGVALRVTPAREYSVAVYVEGPRAALDGLRWQRDRLNVDQCEFDAGGKLRLWWD